MRIYLDTQIWINACDDSAPTLKEWLLSDRGLGSHQFFFSPAIVAELFAEGYPDENLKRDNFLFQVTKGNCFVPHQDGRVSNIMHPMALWKDLKSNPFPHDLFSMDTLSGLSSMHKYLEASAEAQGTIFPMTSEQMETSCEGKNMPDALSGFVGLIDNKSMRKAVEEYGFSFGDYNHLDGYEFAQKISQTIPSESNDPIGQMMKFVLRCSPSDRCLEFQMLAMPIILDLFGYWADKKAKCQKRGRVFDQIHVVEAAFTEAFITDDTGLANRSKATYALLAHKTQVYSSSEMMKQL